jgi:large subunit ribosomal protein LX
MKAFRIIGEFKVKDREFRNDLQDFKVELAAADEKAAREKLVSNLGSHHRVGREEIFIKELILLKNEDITDPVVKHQVGGSK